MSENKADKQEKKIEEGPPIFIESLLSDKELKELCRLLPNTNDRGYVRPPSEFEEGQMKWRLRMGESATPEEISRHNKFLRKLMLEKGLQPSF